MEVRAAVAREASKPLEIMPLILDDPRPHEVRVRMVATGICHTDASVRDQTLPTPLPVVLGHEGAGIVEEVGEGVTGIEPGDHVVLGSNSCGDCRWCLLGHPADCVSSGIHKWAGRRPDGSTAFSREGEAIGSHFFGQSSFATLTNAAERAVIKVPKTAPLELLGPLGCGMATGAGTIFNVLKPDVGSSLVVFGTGAVGCAALLAAKASNCSTIIMVDVVQSRLDRATELGATHVINSSEEDPTAAVRRITGDGAQFAVDTTSSGIVFRQMIDSLAGRGHAARVGGAPAGAEGTVNIGQLMRRSQRITGVRQGDSVPSVVVPFLLDLYQSGQFPFDKLIETYPFDAINDAFADSASGKTLKPVVVF